MSTLPSPLLALRSNGMVTVIGNSTAQTLASWCAETRRSRRLTLDGFADPVTVADCQGVTDGLAGVARLEAMLASAVTEALDEATHLGTGDAGACLEILLAPAWLDDDGCAQLGASLSTWVQPYEAWSGRARSRLVVRGGSTGAWVALEHAYRALAANPDLHHVMLAAVDSLCEPAVLQQAAQDDWLLHPGNEQGYVAGEAAACLLLQRASTIEAVPADGFALHRPALVEASQRIWPGNDDLDAGPLSQALSAALTACGMEATHISHLQSDMDGSDWRARIEATALNRVVFSQAAALPHWLPATLFGQVGNPAGIIAWLLLAGLHRQQVERVNTVLNWAVDPAGLVAACALERSPH
jgi:3-oxoacyl-[acyl-carrier-protein] synthase-1